MQTLLAYAFGEPDAARVAAGLGRVEQHYQRYAGAPLDHRGRDVDAVGLHLWEAAAEGRRWRAWQEDRSRSVATIHAPVRYEALVGDLPPERAAVPLADELRARPEGVLRIGCPFVLATVDDAAELTLFTDAIGIGRLYQLRLPDGWVWSNRPLAPLLFAGLPARRDPRGWHFQRGTDSFMDGTSPFLDVTRVTEATRIQLDGRTGRCLATQIDPLRYWLSGGACGGSEDPLHPQTVAAVAEELQDVARSAGRLWGQRPRLGLSGGRDSRLVAAAFLSAGVDVRVHTNDNPVGEADIARELLGRWPHPVEHHINHPPSAVLAFAPPPTGAIERALQWMRLTEGTQPASYLPRTPPAAWADLAKLSVSGVGGEIGHGGYHPRDVDVVEALPPEERIGAYLERLFLRLTVRGVSARTQETVRQRTEQVLARGIASGAAGVGVVDAFYMLERMPSFTGPGVREDTLVPLLSPGFVSAAVRQSPHQLREAALHRALVAHLIPAWQDVPFFPHFGSGPAPAPRPPAPPPDEGDAARGRSTWEIDPERERVAAILADGDAWAEDFDVEAVQAMWHRAIAGKASGPDQAAIQRVVWQAVFEDYLAELNGEPVRERAPIAVEDVPGAPPPPAPVVPAVPPDNRPHARAIRRLRRRLRRYPLARRVVRGVRSLRSGRS